jgi:Ca2+-binding RTX toxin-like protein
MATFTVTTAADAVDAGDRVLSLREAVQQANSTAAADTILFANALEGRTLTLTQGQLTLTADAAIDGDRDNNGAEVTLSGGGASRVVAVAGAQTDARLADLVVTDGDTSGDTFQGAGAGIRVGQGAGLALTGCTITGNQTFEGYAGASPGGGIAAEAGSRLRIVGCAVTENRGYGAGGGVDLAPSSHAVVVGSLIQDNVASEASSTGNEARGGGIAAEGASLVLIGSAVLDNHAVFGAGIDAQGGSLDIRSSTLASNSSSGFVGFGGGGGLHLAGGRAIVTDTTITNNRDYGGPYGYSPDLDGAGIALDGEAALALRNTIASGNVMRMGRGSGSYTIADDVLGAITSSNGHNIFGGEVVGAAAGDLENVVPARLFAALDPDTGGGQVTLNGGPTPTVRLRDALDNPALSGTDPLDAGSLDQRGVERPLPAQSNPDIGSFELHQRALSTAPSANNDVLTGTARADTLVALPGNDLVRGRGGNDELRGVGGSDTLRGGDGQDRLDGGSGSDLLYGEDGNDRLFGGFNADALFGGVGGDVLRGQFGVDRMRGDAGPDVFAFDAGDTGVGAGRRDLILDFALDADRIDLGSIDAKAGVAGNQAFAFLGMGALTGAGQLRYGFVGTGTVIQASTDADAAPELELQLAGQIALDGGDFLL